MTRIIEPPKQHIHDRLLSELNEMIIRLKLWDDDIFKEDDEAKLSAILKARSNHKKPSNKDLVDLIDRCRDEMNQCTKPYILK
jgi:hypothetical protein